LHGNGGNAGIGRKKQPYADNPNAGSPDVSIVFCSVLVCIHELGYNLLLFNLKQTLKDEAIETRRNYSSKIERAGYVTDRSASTASGIVRVGYGYEQMVGY
jgi:hypothetical protein